MFHSFKDDKKKSLSVLKSLPQKRQKGVVKYIDQFSLLEVILLGLFFYLIVVLSFSIIFYSFNLRILDNNKNVITDFGEFFYFNFITILTIGYGDLAPAGILSRMLAATEALLGVGMFGAWVGIIILKLTVPQENSVVFSKYCYYIEEEETFVVVFINTSHMPLVNVEMCYTMKLDGNHSHITTLKVPYIGYSVWTLKTCKIPVDKIKNINFRSGDSFKFGLTGNYAFAHFGTSIKYSLEDILVLSNDSHFDNDLFEKAELSATEFEEAFHYYPQNGCSFLDYIKKLKKDADNKE